MGNKKLTLDEMLELAEGVKNWEFDITPSGFPGILFDEDDIMYKGPVDELIVSVLKKQGIFFNRYEISVRTTGGDYLGEHTSGSGRVRDFFEELSNQESHRLADELGMVYERS